MRGRNGSLAMALALVAMLLLPVAGPAGAQGAVTVFPAAGTPVASEQTTFSFRGLRPNQLGPVTVTGSRSGFHPGSRLAHSDRDGVSFVPNRPFLRGETVTVQTRHEIPGADVSGRFTVRIGRFPARDRRQLKRWPRNRLRPLVTRPLMRPPSLRIHAFRERASPGHIFFAPKSTGLTIADRRGRVRWFRPTEMERAQVVQDFKPQVWKGRPVLTYFQARPGGPYGGQHREFQIRDRRYRLLARVGLGNGFRPDAHEFMISSRDTALAIAYRAVHWNGPGTEGVRDPLIIDNVIQEIDIPTGAVLFEWHSLGKVPVSHSVVRPQSRATGSGDYFHANSIEEDGDAFLVSARKTNTVYRIDRNTGRIRWRLRGDGTRQKTSSFTVAPDARFGLQHDARRLPNGDISIFDNSVSKRFPPVGSRSSAVVLRLRKPDPEAKATATLVSRFEMPRPVLSYSQASATILPDGNAFVGWGSMRRISELDPTGKVVFDASFATPVNSYRARKAPWAGNPGTRPAVASKARKRGGGMHVWASWNGATAVTAWRLRGGPAPGRLRPVKTVPWQDLETWTPLPRRYRFVRVEALDGNGQVLRRSATTPFGTRSHGQPRRVG